MTALAQQVNQYLNNHYMGMEPEQLILLLYKGALDRIQLIREGIEEKNIRKRGENLSKLIAIISELNSSLDPKMNDDGTQFLRGLYTAILTELPKVSLNNRIDILDRTEAYIKRLKSIWKNDVMGKSTGESLKPVIKPFKKSTPEANSAYNGTGATKSFNAFSV